MLEQLPRMQLVPDEQMLPQEPQLFESELVSVHDPLQFV
jgi:hypothetical protein